MAALDVTNECTQGQHDKCGGWIQTNQTLRESCVCACHGEASDYRARQFYASSTCDSKKCRGAQRVFFVTQTKQQGKVVTVKTCMECRQEDFTVGQQ